LLTSALNTFDLKSNIQTVVGIRCPGWIRPGEASFWAGYAAGWAENRIKPMMNQAGIGAKIQGLNQKSGVKTRGRLK
jgi:hypothetical protein